MKKRSIGFIALMVILVIICAFFLMNHNKDPYEFSGDTLYYSQDRGTPVYEMTFREQNGSVDVYNINFESRNFLDYKTKIYGLLFMPRDKKNVSGLILLPGGGGTKEGEYPLALTISKLGYSVLTFDQRGIGETGGVYLGPDQDYPVFLQKKEPIQHLSVYDSLAAFDILREIKDDRISIDKNNIATIGESMGARYAIIAAAIDPRLRGVIVISSSGFHVGKSSEPYIPYLTSIDPDHYIDKISPNKVFMLHGSNDSVVKLEDAKITYNLAKDPKRFFTAENCQHGYCDKMYDELKYDLDEIFR
ncbi:Serine aminopeptidase, S33 [uncultured archaeon]|nr:Serine aminopeptidase, S33 [uncultured archaeon]